MKLSKPAAITGREQMAPCVLFPIDLAANELSANKVDTNQHQVRGARATALPFDVIIHNSRTLGHEKWPICSRFRCSLDDEASTHDWHLVDRANRELIELVHRDELVQINHDWSNWWRVSVESTISTLLLVAD